MNRQSRAASGFTVLELLVAMGVATVLMAIAVPSFSSWLPALRLSAATRQVVADLRGARMKAISQGTSFQLNFSGTAYVIQKCAGACTNDSGNIVLPEGITASTSAAPQFLPRGTASSSATITLSNGVASSQVQVTPVGRIKII